MPRPKPGELQAFLDAALIPTGKSDLIVRYASTNGQGAAGIAFRATTQQLVTLADYHMVRAGRLHQGKFAYAVLTVPLRVAARVLRTDRPRPHQITKTRGELTWPPHFERAKLGRFGAVLNITHTPVESIEGSVPGLSSSKIWRHVV